MGALVADRGVDGGEGSFMPMELKTDARLLERLHRAAQHQMTAEELRRQRVSFVYGGLPQGSPMTRHDVEVALARLEGGEAA